RVHQTVASSIPSIGTIGRVVIDRVIEHIVGDFLNFIVILWTDIALYRSVLSRRHNRYLFLESNIGAIDKRHDLSISDATKITYSYRTTVKSCKTVLSFHELHHEINQTDNE